METESASNYGVAMEARDERLWAGLAHLSVFVNIFTGFLGPVVAFVIWLVYRDRSEMVAFHALQSAVYQTAWLIVIALGWAVTGVLTIVLVGFLLMPVMFVVSLIPFAHGVYAAYRVGKGRDFRYPIAADMVDGE